jgi:hypothetical protein
MVGIPDLLKSLPGYHLCVGPMLAHR